GGDGLGGMAVQVKDDDLGAGGGEPGRAGPADAARAAGHKCATPGQVDPVELGHAVNLEQPVPAFQVCHLHGARLEHVLATYRSDGPAKMPMGAPTTAFARRFQELLPSVA